MPGRTWMRSPALAAASATRIESPGWTTIVRAAARLEWNPSSEAAIREQRESGDMAASECGFQALLGIVLSEQGYAGRISKSKPRAARTFGDCGQRDTALLQ